MALKPITVNTPAAEPAHILAEDDAAIYAALIGDDRVLDIGGKLAATVISNNKVRITDGVVVVGGHAAIIYKGDYEDMTIENGVSGKKRNDLIVARFIAGDDGGADSYSLVVVKGTAGTSATDPAIVQGNLYNGDKQRDYPLWRVKIEGLSITAVEQLYTVNTTNTDLSDSVSQLNENSVILEKTDSYASGAYSIEYFIFRIKNKRYIKVYGNWRGTVVGTATAGGIYYGNISNLPLIRDAGVTVKRVLHINLSGGDCGGIFVPGNYNGISISSSYVAATSINYLITSPPREINLTWDILCEIE